MSLIQKIEDNGRIDASLLYWCIEQINIEAPAETLPFILMPIRYFSDALFYCSI